MVLCLKFTSLKKKSSYFNQKSWMTTPAAKAAIQTAKIAAKASIGAVVVSEVAETVRSYNANQTALAQARISSEATVKAAEISAKATTKAAETNASAVYYSSDVTGTSCYNKINISFFDFLINCFSLFELSLILGSIILINLFFFNKNYIFHKIIQF